MPYLRVETNLELSSDKRESILKEASAQLVDKLGKPERFVMVQVVGGADLIFGGTSDPAAYVELKSIGLPENQTEPLSRFVCEFLQAQLNILPDRVYVELIDIPRKYWGWNNGTF
ncbi:MAG: phenylpyruvate tautomerase MIF-related protein [Methylohalobius crimeensis]